ncbi:hypothetical protein [Paenibacillus dendritiformis]|uniref:hypothetical protein n=1 Tax=Paenibacillus dendritiformis TaxID=130049 RepID=UPI000DA8A26B|nr:hypothetical protein [Paenibacillus dendritiformis]PZM65266.1 hypothetical protein DOE73_13010 [Paenibacillus dendritiformis]
MHFQYEVDSQLLERHNPAILGFIGQLNADTRSYCTLTLGEDEYIQCAGSASALTVEVRIPGDEPGFRHFVAGVKAEYLLRADAEVTYSGGTIYVKEIEVLNAGQASELFQYFVQNKQIPLDYAARDITNMFWSYDEAFINL